MREREETYKGERETVRDLRPVSGPRSPISMDFFFPCNDAVVTDKLRLDDPPWLAISTVYDDFEEIKPSESSTLTK